MSDETLFGETEELFGDIPDKVDAGLVPQGDYNVTIAAMTEGESQSTGFPYWKLDFTILDGDYAGQWIYGDYRTLSRSPKNKQNMKQNLTLLMAMAGEPLPPTLRVPWPELFVMCKEHLIGLQVRLKVVHETQPGYDTRAKPDRILFGKRVIPGVGAETTAGTSPTPTVTGDTRRAANTATKATNPF